MVRTLPAPVLGQLPLVSGNSSLVAKVTKPLNTVMSLKKWFGKAEVVLIT